MEQLLCKACGAKLNWDGVSDLVTCPYCGSRFSLRPRAQEAEDEVLRDGTGRGTVVRIPFSKTADLKEVVTVALLIQGSVSATTNVTCGGKFTETGLPSMKFTVTAILSCKNKARSPIISAGISNCS